jgi:hypothetical protein
MAASPLAHGEARLRWDLLCAPPSGGERLTTRLALPSEHNDVYIAVDSAGCRFILVFVPFGEPSGLAARTSRGLSVQTVEMNLGDGSASTFIEIACLDPSGHAALDIIVVELTAALRGGASIGRVRLVQNLLEKWRRFWSDVNSRFLSKEQQIGLFGEIWFLHKWLGPTVGFEKAVGMWRGPGGARHDFETKKLGIEVKTAGNINGVHVIHGVEQLEEPEGGALLLFSLLVRDEASGSELLPDLIHSVRETLASDFSSLNRFDTMLYASGYKDEHASEYQKIVLRIRSESLYRVTGNFPRLIPSSFALGVPSGVDELSYELQPSVAGAWLLATNPAGANTLLADFVR